LGASSLDSYLGGANQKNDAILLADPGPARDKALQDYIFLRQLLLNNALRFYGKPSMDQLNDAYRTDEHQRIIALLGERLKDPAFIAGVEEYQLASLRLFATAPFEALPCDTVPEKTAATTGSN